MARGQAKLGEMLRGANVLLDRKSFQDEGGQSARNPQCVVPLPRRRRLSRRWSLNLNSSIRLRSRLYGFHTGTRSLSNRKGRGRRRGGREREPRRAGEGRLVWNRNSCVLIDYGLWAAKSKGRPWVDHCIEQCLDHHPEPRSGLCPELLADFRIPKPPGCSQGAPRAVFCAV